MSFGRSFLYTVLPSPIFTLERPGWLVAQMSWVSRTLGEYFGITPGYPGAIHS
jgi:hypothetical protein